MKKNKKLCTGRRPRVYATPGLGYARAAFRTGNITAVDSRGVLHRESPVARLAAVSPLVNKTILQAR